SAQNPVPRSGSPSDESIEPAHTALPRSSRPPRDEWASAHGDPESHRHTAPNAECTTAYPSNSHPSSPTPRSRPDARYATAPAAPAEYRHSYSVAATTPEKANTNPAQAALKSRCSRSSPSP